METKNSPSLSEDLNLWKTNFFSEGPLSVRVPSMSLDVELQLKRKQRLSGLPGCHWLCFQIAVGKIFC